MGALDIHVHGINAVVEEPERAISVIKRGWGTEIVAKAVADKRKMDPSSDSMHIWVHMAVPAPVEHDGDGVSWGGGVRILGTQKNARIIDVRVHRALSLTPMHKWGPEELYDQHTCSEWQNPIHDVLQGHDKFNLLCWPSGRSKNDTTGVEYMKGVMSVNVCMAVEFKSEVGAFCVRDVGAHFVI